MVPSTSFKDLHSRRYSDLADIAIGFEWVRILIAPDVHYPILTHGPLRPSESITTIMHTAIN